MVPECDPSRVSMALQLAHAQKFRQSFWLTL